MEYHHVSALSAPTGLMSNFSTTVDSNYNPYLAPWLYASIRFTVYCYDDADSAEKDIDISYFPNKNPVYFPEDPNDFNPIGMVRNEYNTPNGLVIKWGYTKKSTVFEWNEDLKNGEHYHWVYCLNGKISIVKVEKIKMLSIIMLVK